MADGSINPISTPAFQYVAQEFMQRFFPERVIPKTPP